MQYKILIVDDDRELLKMLNQYFTLKNYTVMIAENGIEAMEKISATGSRLAAPFCASPSTASATAAT